MEYMVIIAIPILAFIVGIFFLGLSRKIMARIHWRYGPPFVQPVIDIIRLFSQKSISHGKLFSLGIIFSLAGSLAVVLLLPFGNLCPLHASGGLLVILYIMLLGPFGMALSGGEAANPNTSIGISRQLILTLGYEVPLLFILLTVMTHYETISIVRVVEEQQGGSWALFSMPLFLSGIAYLAILPAILGMRPFEIVNAGQEIASGPLVEYSGNFLALATIQQAFSIFIGVALFVNLFLGGGAGPVTFFAKMLVVFVPVVCINACYPRLRTEQTLRYLWKWPTAISFLGLMLARITG
jgi:NADH-quinone oxidoreductase subunit H